MMKESVMAKGKGFRVEPMVGDNYPNLRLGVRRGIRSYLARDLTGVVLAVAMTPFGLPVAMAQDVQEIQITGTRILRDGYEAPTPLTVIGVEEMGQQASTNMIDYLTTLPAFSGNYEPKSSSQNASSGAAGTSAVNLRNLGENRTLVLIDGQRVVPSTVTGLVDISSIPSQLIERVEIVTGGASAAYGSDAVSGVVNFVLNKEFEGFESEISGGVTDYGDDGRYKLALTGGTSFANGRGHVLLSGEHTYQDGVIYGDRPWNQTGWQIINNPDYTETNGQPSRLLLPNIGPATSTPGGIITSGPLKGTAFGEGGVPYQFTYGDLVSGNAMQGGSWRDASIHYDGQSIDPRIEKSNVLGRVSFDLTDTVQVYNQLSYYHNENMSHAYPNDWYFGGLMVNADNPFLPASVAAAARAQGLETLEMGTWFKDMGTVTIDTEREVWRNVLGANGSFMAANTNWDWDFYWQHGVSKSYESAYNSFMFPALADALDSTIHPDTGAIVCRSTLSNANNGCVPYNPFGIGVNDQRALDYVLGRAWREQEFTQNVYAGSITGEPFSTWAGPVSIAAGLEHRKEEVTGKVSELDTQKAYFATNYVATEGSYDVTETFLETVVPLAQDVTFARSLELNAAVRATDYSTSGKVTTWKVGATWRPIDDVLVRATRSRDIRAPNLNDLYNAGSTENQRVINPITRNSVAYYGITSGSLDLVPEEADSTGIGIVYQPSFIPGFSASVDYWNIELDGAINTISAQNIVDLCYQGGTEFCGSINNGQSLLVDTEVNDIAIQPFNLALQHVRGVDFEATYNQDMAIFNPNWAGSFAVRLLGTRYLKNYTDNTLTAPIDTAGENSGDGPAEWRWNASLTYNLEPFSGTLAARGVSSGVYDNAMIECTVGCPTATIDHQTINENDIDGAVYFDLSLNYTFMMGNNNSNMEAFFNIKNIFNKDPVIVAGGPAGVPFDTVTTNPTNYDQLGRTFLAGLRIRM